MGNISIDIKSEYKNIKDYNSFIYVTSLKNELGHSEKYIYEQLLNSSFKVFNEVFNLTNDEIIEVINKQLGKNIVLRDLFEYSFFPSNRKLSDFFNSVKIAEKVGIKRTRCIINGAFNTINEDIDCYIVLNQYYNLALNKLFTLCFKKKFHLLYDKKENNILYQKIPKFNSEQIEALENLSNEISIINIPLCLKDVSLKDIYDCLENKENIRSYIYKSNINTYFDSKYVFIHLYYFQLKNIELNKNIEYERTLYVPIEFFKTKDWNLVENTEQFSYPIENKISKNGILFISEKQKNLPFFNENIMKKVKELLMNC